MHHHQQTLIAPTPGTHELAAIQGVRQNATHTSAQLCQQAPPPNSSENMNCNIPIGTVVDGTNVCMPDSTNQHPPKSPTAPLQDAIGASTPSVRQNAGTNLSADVNHQSVADQSNLAKPSLPPHPMTSIAGQKSCAAAKKQRSQKKSKDLAIMKQRNIEDDDQFWTMVQKKMLALEQSKRNAKDTNTQDSDEEPSESECPTQKKGKALQISPMGNSSTNSFAALQEGQGDDDDYSITIESCDTETNEGYVEPLDMGNHSADERSSPHKHTKSHKESPGSKIKKRHPQHSSECEALSEEGPLPFDPLTIMTTVHNNVNIIFWYARGVGNPNTFGFCR